MLVRLLYASRAAAHVDQDALLLAMKRGEAETNRRWGDPPAR